MELILYDRMHIPVWSCQSQFASSYFLFWHEVFQIFPLIHISTTCMLDFPCTNNRLPGLMSTFYESSNVWHVSAKDVWVYISYLFKAIHSREECPPEHYVRVSVKS